MELFLSVLSTIGWVVLIIVIVIAILIALLLFMPFVYRVRVLKTEKTDASGSLRWLFGAILLKFTVRDGAFDWSFRLFGFPLDRRLKGGRKKKGAAEGGTGGRAQEYRPAKKQPTIRPGEIQPDYDRITEEVLSGAEEGQPFSGQKHAPGTAGYDSGKIRRLSREEDFAEERKPSILEKIRLTIAKIRAIRGKVRDGKALLKTVWPVLKKILAHLRPRKAQGFVRYGFEDPAATGMVTGLLASLCLPLPKKLKIYPDFQEKVLECDAKISGRFFLIYQLIQVIRLMRIPEFREMLKGILPGRKKKRGRRTRRGARRRNRRRRRKQRRAADRKRTAAGSDVRPADQRETIENEK